jgi:hypothetical protein
MLFDAIIQSLFSTSECVNAYEASFAYDDSYSCLGKYSSLHMYM